MRPYHPNNLQLQPYGHKRVIVLAWLAKLFGIQFKIDGIPFGAARAVARLESFGQAMGKEYHL